MYCGGAFWQVSNFKGVFVMHWYDVALWCRWPYNSADFPAYDGRVLAPSAFTAAVALMWRHGLLHVAYAAAGSCEHGCVMRFAYPSLGEDAVIIEDGL